MPPKIRELMAILEKSGFGARSGKGSHRVYSHPALVKTVTISGKLGDDAKHYQVKEVREAIEAARRKQ
ncbi:MAG: type II toxin-antitoxin system HicA family toxin [Pyrinomonadaceae bacterium]